MRAVSRRRALGLGAGIIAGGALAACSAGGAAPAGSPAAGTGGDGSGSGSGNLVEVTIGFLPITCASPIIGAKARGVFEKHGLNVTLKKFAGWAEVWSAYASGELHVAHMLAPMPLAIHHGVATRAVPTKLAAIANTNDQGLTLANKHIGTVAKPVDMEGFTLGIPFDFSIHNLLLRDYLSSGGIDPDRDVQLRLMRPADMVANLATDNIDGFLGPGPFNQRSINAGTGHLHRLTGDMWDGHPCCSLAANAEWADANPDTYRALVAAVAESTHWCDDPSHRIEIADALAPEKYLNQDPELLRAVLAGSVAEVGAAAAGSGTAAPQAPRPSTCPARRSPARCCAARRCSPSAWPSSSGCGRRRSQPDCSPGSHPGPADVWPRGTEILADPFYRDGPSSVGIFWHLMASLRRVLIGFLIAAAIAIPVGFLLGMITPLRWGLEPLVQVLRPVSPLAWLPIGLALLRDSENTALFVIIMSALWPMLLQTISGVMGINPLYRDLARTPGTNRRDTFRHILLPATLPSIVTGMRLSLSTAWLVIIAAEMLVGGRGMGYFVWNMWNRLDIAAIVVAIVIIGVVGFVLDQIVSNIQKVVPSA